MVTADSVKAKIQSIIAKANSTTGRADNNVDSAVDALIDGFGVVNVPTPAQNYHVIPITLSSAVGAGTAENKSILTGNDFVKQHYADDGFFAMWLPLNATTAAASGVAGMVYHGNRPLITAKSAFYGLFMRSTGETANPSFMGATAKISGSGYNVSLRANSSGDIKLYVAASYTVPAGDYLLVLGLAE